MTTNTDDDGLMSARTAVEKERAKQERRIAQYVRVLGEIIYMGDGLKTADQKKPCCKRENLTQTSLALEYHRVDNWPHEEEDPYEFDLDDSFQVRVGVEKDADEALKTFVDRATNGIYHCRSCDQAYSAEEASRLPRN